MLGSYVYDTCSQIFSGKEFGKQSLSGKLPDAVRSVPTQRQNGHATVLIMAISNPMYSLDFCISQMACSSRFWATFSVNRITNTTVKSFVKSIIGALRVAAPLNPSAEESSASKYLYAVVPVLSNFR